jgi:hypothetical protein
MERMINDPDVKKVILICDKKYSEKANKRAGGVGTEAQIITPALYRQTVQSKFVAVIKEMVAYPAVPGAPRCGMRA